MREGGKGGKEGKEGRREGGKEERRKGGKEERRKGGKEGRREGGKEGRREGGKEGRKFFIKYTSSLGIGLTTVIFNLLSSPYITEVLSTLLLFSLGPRMPISSLPNKLTADTAG